VSLFSQNIAVMDPRVVLDQYQKRLEFENDLREKEKNYQKIIFDERIKILEEEGEQLKKYGSLSQEEKRKITSKNEKLDEKYDEMENSLKELHLEYQNILKSDITIAAVIVGKEKGYDIVISKEVSFYGGVDITQDVIEFLNSSDRTLLEESLKNGSKNLELIR
jgi:Skp family chaperone for outer membrane proteins